MLHWNRCSRFSLVITLGAVLALSACDDNDDGVPAPTATAEPTSTQTATRTTTATIPPPATETRTATPPLSPTSSTTAVATHTATNPLEETATATRTSTVVELATPTTTQTAEPTVTELFITATATREPTPTATNVPILTGASKSSAVAIAPDESYVIVVNPDNDSITVLDTSNDTVRARVDVGDEPVAVVIHPDGKRAYVANRASASVSEIIGLDTDTPSVFRTNDLGSEPTGLALSPAGTRLYVTQWAEGAMAIVDTDNMGVVILTGLRNPRAVAITNDGDGEENDETLIVTEFYGEPNPDTTGCPSGTAEACDTGRIGRILRFSLGGGEGTPIVFSPLDSGIVPNGASATAMTSPNQLYAAAVHAGKVYVTSVSASPQPPLVFNGNVYPVVYVADLATGMEDRSNVGTANLAKLANDQVPDLLGTDRFFLQEIVDLSFVGTSNIAYVVSRAADTVQEVVYDASTGVRLGLPQINVGGGGCQNPIGIAVANNLNRAYVNCWLTRRIAIVNLADKTFSTVPSAELPVPNTPEDDIRLGRRFYFTGRGRWSEEGEGYSSCGSCHPDGLSDNITWSFAAGPRQSTSMDGSFSHGQGPQKRRLLNWTAIFEELHDFERNTRGVSGGLGAITTSPTSMCDTLAEEVQVAIPADGLGVPLKEIQDSTPGVCTHDWDKIDAFVRTIRPPRARRFGDENALGRGAQQFAQGQCANCHGGAGWTVSRRFWEPSTTNNIALMSAPFSPLDPASLFALQTVQIGVQPAAADPIGMAVPPNETACVLRRVGSFGIPGDVTATDLLERKVNNQRAQGAGGFNVPSLYGLAVGAPYLHHGLAPTLEALFTDARWEAHRKAGNADYAPTQQQVEDLVAYLYSVDAAALEVPLPENVDACPASFDAPTPTTTATITETATATTTASATVGEPSETPTPPLLVDTQTQTPSEVPTSTATPTTAPPLLRNAGKGGAIALAPDQSFVILVNPDDDSVTIVSTFDNSVRTRLDAVGDGPVAVVVHPDSQRAYVVNRGDATVVEIVGLPDSPGKGRVLGVGSEPTGVALSPNGGRVYVAQWADSGVAEIRTDTFERVRLLEASNPRSVAVTDDGDGDDGDETLVVTEFYGQANADVTGCPTGTAEACDTGRIGRIRRYDTGTAAELATIFVAPIDSGIVPNGAAGTAMTSPNQLYAAAIRGSKVYVTSVSASPEPPLVFNGNVYPVVYVGDLTSGTEDRSNLGSVNLAKLANQAIPDQAGTDRLFLQEIVDIAFAGDTDRAFVVSRAADAVQEVIYDLASGVRLGLPQIDLGAAGCQNPIGIVVSSFFNRAYVNCWLTARLALIDLDDRSVATVSSAELPEAGTVENDIRLGRRFYFTGRGRWSDEGEGYSSCGSCHPDGLSDNITWAFAAGPRQSTSMDGSFSHGPATQKRRILNWTGIFDELHDFERNTRGVSGGLGAITTSPTGMCGVIANEVQVAVPADGLGTPLKEIQDTTPGVCTHDWDRIDDFVRTIRPPRALTHLDPEAVEAGRAQFAEADCAKCHGGAGWTLSRRYWSPSTANNTALMSAPFGGDVDGALQTTHIGPQPAAADNTGAAIPPNSVSCVLRRVGTFGIPGDTAATDLLERKVNGQRAQGAGGFNVPALYGLAVGAPYLHHGQAPTLALLFTDPRWASHLKAGKAGYEPAPEDIDNLVAYLLSIDANQTESDRELAQDDTCPEVFPDGTTQVLDLNGSQEVPNVPTTATAHAEVTLSGDDRTIAVRLIVNPAQLTPENILFAHIHVGPVGENGPVAMFLAHRGFSGVLLVTLGEDDFLPNPAAATFAEFITALKQGNTYINLHTQQFMGGEVRGQIPAF